MVDHLLILLLSILILLHQCLDMVLLLQDLAMDLPQDLEVDLVMDKVVVVGPMDLLLQGKVVVDLMGGLLHQECMDLLLLGKVVVDLMDHPLLATLRMDLHHLNKISLGVGNSGEVAVSI